METKNYARPEDVLNDQEAFVLNLVSELRTVTQIMRSTGLSEPVVVGLIRSVKFALHAGRDEVANFVSLVDEWEGFVSDTMFFNKASKQPDLSGIILDEVSQPSGKATQKTESVESGSQTEHILKNIADQLEPRDMREMGASLLKLADAIDQDFSVRKPKERSDLTSEVSRIERKAADLSSRATRILRQNRTREKYLSKDFLGEPAWNILLELFRQFSQGAKVSSKSLCISAGCPDTTALRYMDKLEELGLLRRNQSEVDGRVTLIELTADGICAVGNALEAY